MNTDIYDIDYSLYDCVYFDIPYKGTSKYDVEFNHDRFWDFFMGLPMKAFASEYSAPENIPLVASIDKRTLMQNKNNNGVKKGIEKVYTNRF